MRPRRDEHALSVQLAVNALGQRVRYAGYSREILDARRLHSLQAAEMREQRLAALGADAADLLQCRRVARLCASRAMTLDREAMRLVADLLQQMQSRVVGGQVEHRFAAGENDIL